MTPAKIFAAAPSSPIARTQENTAASRFSRLTGRQMDCLRLVAEGYTSKEIGRRLGISHSTVNNHLQEALRLLEISGRAEAARRLVEYERKLGHEMPRHPEPLAAVPGVSDDRLRIAEPGQMGRLATLLPPIGGHENDLQPSQRVYAIARIALFSTLVFVACVIVIRTCFDALR